ncbi:MAG: hypothetical protein WD603_00420 [Patescibacteria group bacterium]
MSKSIDLSEVRSAEAEAVAASEERKEKFAALDGMNQELYDRVRAGETTGDRLIDHVILRNHKLDQEAVDLFRSLEERVAAHANEPVLVISRGVNYRTHVFGKGWKDPYVVERRALGILARPELVIREEGQWGFPTDSYVCTGSEHDVRTGSLTTRRPGKFTWSQDCPLEGALDTPVQVDPGDVLRGLRGGGSPAQLEIAIGTEEVEAKVRESLFFDDDQYRSMLDQLMQFPEGDVAADSDRR